MILPGGCQKAITTSQQSKQVLTPYHAKGQARVAALLPLAINDVRFYFTLFSKYFSSFVHTTCSLSVSVQYLAFAGVHLRICTALSNCATLGVEECGSSWPWPQDGTIALHGKTFQNVLDQDQKLTLRSLHYNSTISGSFHRGFKHRLYPFHSPLLWVSQLFSFPPLSDMLKFSG